MSLDASGSLAGTIVYSKWKGRPYVRQLVVPSNPQSALQVSTRAMMKFLSQRWATDVSAPDKATWDTLAAAQAMSAFNAFVQHNLQRWTQFKAPSMAYPAVETGTAPTYTTAPTAVGGVGQVTISWDVNAANNVWGLLIFRSVTPAFTPARDNLKMAVYGANLAADLAIESPVPVGSWRYNARPFSSTGLLFTATGETTAVVT
jgi:hypothetical protein